MAAKPKGQRKKWEGEGEDNNFERERRGKKGRSWCRGVGRDRGQSRQKTTGEEKEKRHLFGPKSRPFQKRPLKSAVQAGVPEREREKREPRNAW